MFIVSSSAADFAAATAKLNGLQTALSPDPERFYRYHSVTKR